MAQTANTSGRPRFRRLWILLGLVVLGVAVYPWVRPYLKTTSDHCRPEGLPTVRNVPLTVCVDPRIWSWFVPVQASKQSYGNGREKIYFDSIGFAEAHPEADLRAFIIKGANQYGTNKEVVEIVGERDVTLGGRPWHAIEFATHTAQFVDYYYSAEGFGTIQLFFLSFKENLARRDELAAQILNSIEFTD